MKKELSHIKTFLLILCTLTVWLGCKKEYSLEGNPLQIIPIPADTTSARDTAGIAMAFPYCNTCSYSNMAAELTWSFKIDTSLFCGNVTNGVISPDGKGMTFFGPSACSRNYGLIITAFFNDAVFTMDQNHLVATHVTLQFYDHTGTSDILQSKPPLVFGLIFDTYSKFTKQATGSFNGSALNKAGDLVAIKAGRFRVRF